MDQSDLRGVRIADAKRDRLPHRRPGPSLPHRAGATSGVGWAGGRRTRSEDSLRDTPEPNPPGRGNAASTVGPAVSHRLPRAGSSSDLADHESPVSAGPRTVRPTCIASYRPG